MRTFSQLLLFSTFADLISLLSLVTTLPREIAIGHLLVVQFHGFCVAPSEILCWLSFGVLQSMYPISSALLTSSFGFRFAAIANYNIHRCAVPGIVLIVGALFLPYVWMFENIFRRGLSDDNNTNISALFHVDRTQMSIIDQNESFTKFSIQLALMTAVILFLLSLLLSSLLLRKLRTVQNNLSVHSRHAHFMLNRALNLQLPISSIYFCAALIFLMNSKGIIGGEYVEYLSVPMTNLQNLMMPIVNLWIIQPYRKCLIGVLRSGSHMIFGYRSQHSSTISHK
ncbi:hypothetical protein PRIPAC_77546 [Pristionchus pacificus]|uniref:G protein-coupled receptor n=1 Tax=Pristionchus pacificus TaxID=54126 RepID=A0A2A6CNT8_PRIPA|nr:hypothetical protein PRIPAC_77546 [Pristionchus pacificus]|eukprot:PDM79780.1 G protein-coupled receptor [Pristionchus pacificus]